MGCGLVPPWYTSFYRFQLYNRFLNTIRKLFFPTAYFLVFSTIVLCTGCGTWIARRICNKTRREKTVRGWSCFNEWMSIFASAILFFLFYHVISEWELSVWVKDAYIQNKCTNDCNIVLCYIHIVISVILVASCFLLFVV